MKFSKKTAAIIALFALFVQIIIISYNHLTGFIQVKSLLDFLQRILIGTTFSAVFGIILVYINMSIITFLGKRYPWKNSSVLRFIYEALSCIIIAVLIGAAITIAAHIPFPYDDLLFNIINNALITVIINIIIITALEAVRYFGQHEAEQLRAEKLERENAQIRLEVLKNQLNPHFLFNSLNVLSALIQKDTAKSQLFIDEFSSIYRYILEVIDKPVVELRDEISFAKSYLLLQQIRFEDAVKYEINIDAVILNRFIPPLAVQTLLENALKHNKAAKEDPLCIKIFNEGDYLYVTNNLQAKFKNYKSTGIGLDNLKKRYRFVAGEEPGFTIRDNTYVAKLPLIKPE